MYCLSINLILLAYHRMSWTLITKETYWVTCQTDAWQCETMMVTREEEERAKMLGVWVLRTVHSPTFSAGNSRIPADSSGIRWSQIPECLGVTRAKPAYLFQEESGGVHWKPAYSSGVRGIRPDFFRWGSPLDSGGIQWNNQTPAE